MSSRHKVRDSEKSGRKEDDRRHRRKDDGDTDGRRKTRRSDGVDPGPSTQEDQDERRRRKRREQEKKQAEESVNPIEREGQRDDGDRRRHRDERKEKEHGSENRKHRDKRSEDFTEDPEKRRSNNREKESSAQNRRDVEGKERRRRENGEDGKDRDKEREKRRGEDRERRRGEDGDRKKVEDGERRRGDDREKRRGEDGERRKADDRDRRRGEDGDKRRGEDGDKRRRGEDKERRRGEDGERRKGDDRERRRGEDGDKRRLKEKRDHDTDNHRRRDSKTDNVKENRRDEDRNRRREEDRKKKNKQEDEIKNQIVKSNKSRNDPAMKISDKHRGDTTKKVQSKKVEEEQEVEDNDDDNDEYNYDDDDFEDYEDDFEDEDTTEDVPIAVKHKNNEEMSEILSALNRENDRLLTDSKINSSRSTSVASPVVHNSPVKRRDDGKFAVINFMAAHNAADAKVATSKARRRGNDLLKLIELDTVQYDLLDIPPVSEYEIYMRSFGNSCNSQTYVQTNDDCAEIDVQTEPIETNTRWSQHPSDNVICCASENYVEEKHEIDTSLLSTPLHCNILTKFLKSAGQVISRILDEERYLRDSFSSATDAEARSSSASRLCIGAERTPLSYAEVLASRTARRSRFAEHDSRFIAVDYTPQNNIKAVDHLSKSSLICIWNITESSMPNRILICNSQVKCSCFAPNNVNIVFAGMKDGSLCVWDHNEPISLHSNNNLGEDGVLIRYPSYNTALIISENHRSEVMNIHTITNPDDKVSDSSYQLASLEKHGVINLWVLVNMNSTDLTGSESDLGLRPGSKIKLVHSRVIQLHSPYRNPSEHLETLDFMLMPSNNSHLYVTTNKSCIMHLMRYGERTSPKLHQLDEYEGCVTVSCLDFSPFDEPVFLAGYTDGTVAMFNTRLERPLYTWSAAHASSDHAPSSNHAPSPITAVHWSKSRPLVFFALDADSTMSIWDLSMDDRAPIKLESISKHSITNISMSNCHSSTGKGIPGRSPQMLLAHSNGEVEIHTISKQFSTMMPEELENFSSFIDNII